MSSLTPKAESWRSKGSTEDFNDHKVHVYYRDSLEAKSSDFPLVVFLHGFPTCSFDWSKVIDLFTSHPVLAFDFLGFGLSDKPRQHAYTLVGHADLTLELIRRYNGKRRPIFFVGHDMGTSVCAEILARQLYDEEPLQIEVAGVLLFNGNMVMDKASLVLGQTLLRSPLGFIFSALQTKAIFRWQLVRAVTPRPTADTEEWLDTDSQWALLNYKDGRGLLHKTIEYTFERVTNAKRLHGAIRDSTVSITFAWGMDDPVATAELQFKAWKGLRPLAICHELHGLGHYPQLEDSALFAQLLTRTITKCDRPITAQPS